MNAIIGIVKVRWKVIVGIIVALVIFGAIIAGVSTIVSTFQRAADYDKIKAENDELQAELRTASTELESALQQVNVVQQKLDDTQEKLTYEQKEVTLLKESTNSLKEQVAGLNAEKEDLNNKLENLLHVQNEVPVITRSVLEEQISSLSELVTKKYMYRNAAQKDDSKTWLWGWTMPLSDTTLLATYDGVITTSIDLKEIKFSVNERTKTITITMPESKIFEHNIPQETINVIQARDNLFNKVTFNDYNQFISSEKIEMEKTAIEHGLLTEADEEAKRVIEAFLKTIPGIDAYALKFS